MAAVACVRRAASLMAEILAEVAEILAEVAEILAELAELAENLQCSSAKTSASGCGRAGRD